MTGVSKRFGAQQALADVSITVRQGEVHALLGQNGSGKSSLIKVLAGFHQADTGSAQVQGRPLELGSASASRAAGIRFIHQDLGLISEMDAVENLALGGRFASRVWLSDRRERRAARDALAAYNIDVDVAAPLEALSAAQRTMVAIVRALRSNSHTPGLLVLDEPTASLPNPEVRQLFSMIDDLRRRGDAALYVTHRLTEVFDIADRVTVLRDGRVVATEVVADLTPAKLVELIVGGPVEEFYPTHVEPRDEIALEVDGIGGGEVAEVSFRAQRGEQIGVTGVVGSGYDQLLGLIFGARTQTRGAVRIDTRELVPNDPASAIKNGLAYAPSDRKRLSALQSWSVRENVSLPKIGVRGMRWLGEARERNEVQSWIDSLNVVPNDPEKLFSALSGGNQQKAVLARWMRCGASVVLLDEPTNGVDQGSKHGIYETMKQAAAGGTTFVFASSDLEELCAVCDRVLVMVDGRISGVVSGADLTVPRLMHESLRVPTGAAR